MANKTLVSHQMWTAPNTRDKIEQGNSAKRDTAELEVGGLLLDQNALDNIRAVQREGEPSLLDKIIKLYFENSPKLLQALHDAIAEDKAPDAIMKAAHSLKSSSANVGATGLAALCSELEDMARKNYTAGAEAIVNEIDNLYPLVCQKLAAECSIREPLGDRRIMGRRDPGGALWGNDHAINLRLSIPLIFGGCYLTIVAGKERRKALRRGQDRLEHPILRRGNLIFLLGLGTVLGLAGLALIQLGAVYILEEADFLVGR